jgi:hypothetical protein
VPKVFFHFTLTCEFGQWHPMSRMRNLPNIRTNFDETTHSTQAIVSDRSLC